MKNYDENDKKYKIDLNYESSNYFSCIVVVNSIEDLEKNESVNKLNKNILKFKIKVFIVIKIYNNYKLFKISNKAILIKTYRIWCW